MYPVLQHHQVSQATVTFFGFIFAYLCFRSGLSKLMKSRAGELEVNMLLYAIQKTTSFEKLLAQRYTTSAYMEKVHVHR